MWRVSTDSTSFVKAHIGQFRAIAQMYDHVEVLTLYCLRRELNLMKLGATCETERLPQYASELEMILMILEMLQPCRQRILRLVVA
jgi:hypothetical protein